MSKVSIKSEKIIPFGGTFHVRERFSRFVGPVIDKVLGLRCTSFGYQYSEIVGSLSSAYFCGGDCVEEQWLRMDKAAKVLHGREHCVPAADSTQTQLLQVPHGQDRRKSLRTKEDQPHPSLRIQIHQRASQMDKDGKALSAEYLHGQQIISEPFCIH